MFNLYGTIFFESKFRLEHYVICCKYGLGKFHVEYKLDAKMMESVFYKNLVKLDTYK
jgi:hypothetical protein